MPYIPSKLTNISFLECQLTHFKNAIYPILSKLPPVQYHAVEGGGDAVLPGQLSHLHPGLAGHRCQDHAVEGGGDAVLPGQLSYLHPGLAGDRCQDHAVEG